MIDSNSYYQARLERRYYNGKMTRRQFDDAVLQNRWGKRVAGRVHSGRVMLPSKLETT